MQLRALKISSLLKTLRHNGFIAIKAYILLISNCTIVLHVIVKPNVEPGGRTGLVVRASDSGSGDPGSILGRVGVLFP